MQFNAAPVRQTSFHIIPRHEGECLAGHGCSSKADIAELQAIAEQIAAAL